MGIDKATGVVWNITGPANMSLFEVRCTPGIVWGGGGQPSGGLDQGLHRGLEEAHHTIVGSVLRPWHDGTALRCQRCLSLLMWHREVAWGV